MAAAAVTRGTPGGKSQGLSPASPPPRQGAQLHAFRVWSTAPGTTVPPPRLPPPCCFRPPSPRQGAPLGAGPHHRPESAGTAPRPPAPGYRSAPCPPGVHELCSAASPEHPGFREGPSHLEDSPRTPAPFRGSTLPPAPGVS